MHDVRRFATAALGGTLAVTTVAFGALSLRTITLLFQNTGANASVGASLAASALVASELGAALGWPIAWGESARRSVAAGESLARMAIGERAAVRVGRLWPATMLLASFAFCASFAWGSVAHDPLSRLAERVGCGATPAPHVVALGDSAAQWLCRDGARSIALTAGDVDVVAKSIDLPVDADATTRVIQAQIAVHPEVGARTLIAVGELQLIGATTLARSPLPPLARAVATSLSLVIATCVATAAALGRARAGVGSTALRSAVGPLAALAVVRLAELQPSESSSIRCALLAPVAAALVTLAAGAPARWTRRWRAARRA